MNASFSTLFSAAFGKRMVKSSPLTYLDIVFKKIRFRFPTSKDNQLWIWLYFLAILFGETFGHFTAHVFQYLLKLGISFYVIDF